MSEVKNKVQMYDLLGKGAFGNTLPLWSPDEMHQHKGLVGVRSVGRPGLPCVTGILPAAAQWVGREIKQKHYCEVAYYPHPDVECIILQGELMDAPRGLHLEYTTVKEPMRPALAKERRIISGLAAKDLLQRHMTEASWADMEALLECYPNAVVEFGIYDHCLGTLRGRNCLVWEVRSGY